MRPPAVLVLGFNRPDRLASLLTSLRADKPAMVCVAIDGPRSSVEQDAQKVLDCQNLVGLIDWDADVRTLFREHNLGLERAVTEAVTWAVDAFDSVIVIEDDVQVGPQLIEFSTRALERWERQEDVFHVSGYNVAPVEQLTHPEAPARLSRVPESFTWATWRRAWSHYDPTLSWSRAASIGDIARITGSRTAALRWKQNFGLARRGLISSWAYRWIDSIWSRGGYCVSPNRNLATYGGYTDGTHTRRAARWLELPIDEIDIGRLGGDIGLDQHADSYIHRQVFRGTALGVALGPAEALALEMVKRRRRP